MTRAAPHVAFRCLLQQRRGDPRRTGPSAIRPRSAQKVRATPRSGHARCPARAVGVRVATRADSFMSNTNEPRLPDIATFLKVHRTGSITGAARELGVTPSQVSK